MINFQGYILDPKLDVSALRRHRLPSDIELIQYLQLHVNENGPDWPAIDYYLLVDELHSDYCFSVYDDVETINGQDYNGKLMVVVDIYLPSQPELFIWQQGAIKRLTPKPSFSEPTNITVQPTKTKERVIYQSPRSSA